MLRWLKANSIPLMLAGAFFAGALINGWYRDAESYKEASVAITAVQKEQARQGKLGAEWQRELRKLAKSRGEVIREVQTIVERPIYSAQCIDDDGVRVANGAKNGAGSSTDARVRGSTGSAGRDGKTDP